MKKKLLSLLVTCACISSTLLIQQTDTKQAKADTLDNLQDQIYSKTTKLDLSGYDLKLIGDTPTLKEKSGNLKHSMVRQTLKLEDENVKNFNNIIKDNGVKDFIVKLVKEGKDPGKIATKTVYDEKVYDNDGKQINDRLLTQKEVNDLNLNDEDAFSANNEPVDSSNSKGRLVLSLCVSNPSSNQHWVQSSISWSLKGMLGSDEDCPADGDDFLSVGWDNRYCTLANGRATGQYRGFESFTPDLCKTEPRSGAVWSFKDYLYPGRMSSNVYVGVGVENTESRTGRVGFTASYSHTWKDVALSFSVSSSGGLSLSTSNPKAQWTIATDLSEIFN